MVWLVFCGVLKEVFGRLIKLGGIKLENPSPHNLLENQPNHIVNWETP